MPIYAYKCESCGHAKDVLQKMSDAPLTDCPACGAPAFKKQLTAAGFQLKGSGWYVTDFRGGDGASKAPKSAEGEASSTAAASGSDKPGDSAATPSTTTAATPAAAAASPAPAPAKTGSNDTPSKSS
jgi:putative FmdB family regulatory protein